MSVVSCILSTWLNRGAAVTGHRPTVGIGATEAKFERLWLADGVLQRDMGVSHGRGEVAGSGPKSTVGGCSPEHS